MPGASPSSSSTAAKEITANYRSMSSYSKVNLDSYGITPRYVLERDLFNHRNKLLFGLDYYDEELDKDGFADRGTGYTDQYRRTCHGKV